MSVDVIGRTRRSSVTAFADAWFTTMLPIACLLLRFCSGSDIARHSGLRRRGIGPFRRGVPLISPRWLAYSSFAGNFWPGCLTRRSPALSVFHRGPPYPDLLEGAIGERVGDPVVHVLTVGRRSLLVGHDSSQASSLPAPRLNMESSSRGRMAQRIVHGQPTRVSKRSATVLVELAGDSPG